MFGFALVMFLGKSITNGVDLMNKKLHCSEESKTQAKIY
jgi:hypothetical protein